MKKTLLVVATAAGVLCCNGLAGCGSTLQALTPEPQQVVVQPPPLKVSILPPALDTDKLLPPEPAAAVIVPAGARRFDDLPVGDGRVLCDGPKEKPAKCADVPPGVLIDEPTYAQRVIADQVRLKRVGLELGIVRELLGQERTQVRAAEVLYQQRIVGLEQNLAEAQKPKRWESWRFYVGFVVGAGLTIASAWAMHEAAK